jgi:hypothetical protein
MYSLAVTFLRHDREMVRYRPSIDTVVLWPDQSRMTLCWRSTLPVEGPFDVRAVLVGPEVATVRDFVAATRQQYDHDMVFS